MRTSPLSVAKRSCGPASSVRRAAAAVALGTLFASAYAAQSVSINNVPLPVTGTVNMTGAVNATVVNSPANPLPITVKSASVAPYQATSFANSSTCSSQNCFLQFPRVPEGKRLMLESASGQVTGAPAVIFQKAEASLFVAVPVGQNYFTTPVLFFYEAGEIPVGRIFFANPSLSTSFVVTIVGKLVSLD